MTSGGTDIIVTMRHVRAARMCASGAREWFKKNNLDFLRFTREGLPIETIEAAGGSAALIVAALARKETTNGP